MLGIVASLSLMGISFGKNGWRLLDIETKEFFKSRDVKYDEHVFPFASLADSSASFPTEDIHDDFLAIDFPYLRLNILCWIIVLL